MNIDKHNELVNQINGMSYEEMARFYRFTPLGHQIFTDPYYHELFMQRFLAFGGMTPAMSKQIGWVDSGTMRH